MVLGLANKTVLVVGGGNGLGKAIALDLANEGAIVGVVARTLANTDNVVSEMGGRSKGHWGIAKDLVPDDAPKQLIEDILHLQENPIDIIIHNLGGTLNIIDPFCDVAEWRRVWRLNLEIAIELNNFFAPKMKVKGWGRIIHISSVSAVLNHGSLPYCAVKSALNAYIRNFGAKMASFGVVISGIMPGAILADGSPWQKTLSDNPAKVENFLNSKLAINRFAKPEEISAVVAFLASEKASFCCGGIFPVDGGSR